MLRVLLEACGHTVFTAFDGLAALELAEAQRPDAILLDIGLPGLNGYDVCRRLREREWCSDTLIVAQTGWGQEQDRDRSRAAGFDQHFTKPIDDEALLQVLTEWRTAHDVGRASLTGADPGADRR